MINKLPIIGWLFSLIAAVGLSVPFWWLWTVCDIGTTYFYFVPTRFQDIPFWDCVGLFIVISILKGTLVPTLASVSNTNNCDKH